jgi:Holliday junction resolvasome RuvABC endonuclease subunit
MPDAPILHRPAPFRIAGLDPSSSRLGYAAPSGELVSLRPSAGAEDPARRLYEISRLVDDAIRRYPPRPDLVVLEGYALGSPHRHTLLTLGEVGGVVRLRLFELDVPFVIVTPANLKRFATGNGNADKARMIARAVELGARRTANDDEADAFHLRRMGRAAHSLEFPLVDHELDALASSGVTW